MSYVADSTAPIDDFVLAELATAVGNQGHAIYLRARGAVGVKGPFLIGHGEREREQIESLEAKVEDLANDLEDLREERNKDARERDDLQSQVDGLERDVELLGGAGARDALRDSIAKTIGEHERPAKGGDGAYRCVHCHHYYGTVTPKRAKAAHALHLASLIVSPKAPQ